MLKRYRVADGLQMSMSSMSNINWRGLRRGGVRIAELALVAKLTSTVAFYKSADRRESREQDSLT